MPEDAGIEPVTLAVGQRLELEGQRALDLLGAAVRRAAGLLDDQILAQLVLALAPAREPDGDGRHGVQPRALLIAHIVQGVEAGRRPPGIGKLAEAQRHHAAEIEAVVGQLAIRIVEVQIRIIGILRRDAAAAVQLADIARGRFQMAHLVAAQIEALDAALGQHADHGAHRGRGLGIVDPGLEIPEGVPMADMEMMQRDDPAVVHRQGLAQAFVNGGQARGPARDEDDIGAIAPDDLRQHLQHRLQHAAHRALEMAEIDGELHLAEVEAGPAAPRDLVIDPGEDGGARRLALGEELGEAEGLGGPIAAFLRGFVAREHAQRDGLGDLDGELLAADLPGHALSGAIAPEELGDRGTPRRHARGLGGILDGTQDMLLDHMEDHVVPGDAEALAEELLGKDGRIGAGAVIAIVDDHEIRGAAADIEGGDAQGFRRGVVGPAHDVEEGAGMAGKIPGDLGIHVDGLGRAGFVPFEQDLRQIDIGLRRLRARRGR